MPIKYMIVDLNGEPMLEGMLFESVSEALSAMDALDMDSSQEYTIKSVETSGAV